MIGNITKGNDFGKLLKYLLEKEKASLVSSNMYGKDSRSLAAEFNLSLALRPNIKRAVYHVSLSLDPREKLTNRSWEILARKYLEGMGFKDSQFVTVKHRDRQHSHLHIVTSRIDLNGNVVNTYNDYFRSQKVIRPLEREFNLKQLHCSWELDRHQQTRHEIELLNRTWDNSVRRHLQNTIDEIVDYQSPLTVQQLLKELETRQISHQVHYADNGAVRGLSYSYNEINYSGNSLGVAYTFNGLQKHRGVSCDCSVEREIYTSCTPSPETPTATLELLQERELQLNLEQLEIAAELEREREKLEIERERERQEIEEQRKRREIEKERIRIEIERERLEEVRIWREHLKREKQKFIADAQISDLNRSNPAGIYRQPQREQSQLEIKNLAPLFTPVIEYTLLKGLPIADAPARLSFESDLIERSRDRSQKGLYVETKNYIITLKNNPDNIYHQYPNEELSLGYGCRKLTIERKNGSAPQVILSVNFRDDFDIQPGLNNVYIVENRLTDLDTTRLQSLEKQVTKIQNYLQKTQKEALLRAIETENYVKKESLFYYPEVGRIKRTVIDILSVAGETTNNYDLAYNFDNLAINWKQTPNPDDLLTHHQLQVCQRDRILADSTEPIFKCVATTSQICSEITGPDWQVTDYAISYLHAQQLFDRKELITQEARAREKLEYERYLNDRSPQTLFGDNEHFNRQVEQEKAAIAAQQKLEKAKLEIKDLAPIFIAAIEYTKLEGVPIKDAPCKQSINSTFLKIFGGEIDDGLCLETENYIITVKNNPQSNYDLEPSQHLKNGTSCSHLCIERKGRVNSEILSLNFFDEELPDLNNVHIVHNSLTSNDKSRLISLQKAVERINAEIERQREQQQRELEKIQRQLELDRSPYTGDLYPIKNAAIKIISQKGHEVDDSLVKESFESNNLKYVWKQKYLPQKNYYLHKIEIQRLDTSIDDDKKSIFSMLASTLREVWDINKPNNWQIQPHNLSELTAGRIFDLEAKIDRTIQTNKFKEYAQQIVWGWGVADGSYRLYHGTFSNDRYSIKIDDDYVRVWSTADRRGEIYRCSNLPYSDPVKTATINNFNAEDYQWFQTAHDQIQQRHQENERKASQRLERERQLRREQQRDRGGGGLEL